MSDISLTITLAIISGLLSGGLVSGVIVTILQNRNEKETRIFNAKLNAYSKYIANLRDLYLEVAGPVKLDEESPLLFKLEHASSEVILVCPENVKTKIESLNMELDGFFREVAEYKKKHGKFPSGQSQGERISKIVTLRKEITDSLRKDLSII